MRQPGFVGNVASALPCLALLHHSPVDARGLPNFYISGFYYKIFYDILNSEEGFQSGCVPAHALAGALLGVHIACSWEVLFLAFLLPAGNLQATTQALRLQTVLTTPSQNAKPARGLRPYAKP